MKSTRNIILAAALILLTAPCRGQESDTWKAGWARVDITPDEPVWQGGYAARQKPSEGVFQHIWAKALALEDVSGHKSVLVTMDLLGLPRDFSEDLRGQVLKKYGIRKQDIILSASHTHSAPVVGNSLQYIYPMDRNHWKAVYRYTDRLKGLLLDVIGESLKKSEPVRMYSGNGYARIGFNRRKNNRTFVSSTVPVGPSDFAVPVLKLEGMDNSVKLVLFGHACHPVVNGGCEISGDWAGVAQSEVEKLYPGAMGMFFQGCGADQNPVCGGMAPNSFMVAYGKQIAAAVEQVLSEPMRPLRSELDTRYAEIDLPFDKPISREEMQAVADSKSWESRWAKGMMERLDKGEKFPDTYPYPIEYWDLGGQKLFVLGGEVTSEYSITLKKKFGEDAFVMGYANDVMSYIPSTTVWREGGYEGFAANRVYALPARWTGDVETRILDAVDSLVK